MLCDSLDIMFDNGLTTNLGEWLWNGISEWLHTRSFSGCHDNEVHTQ